MLKWNENETATCCFANVHKVDTLAKKRSTKNVHFDLILPFYFIFILI